MNGVGPTEISIAGGALAILFGGYRRVWCWYYQLLDERARAAEQLAALALQLEKTETREREWRDLALEQRALLRQATAKLQGE